jgi:hypothetical protein
MVLAALLAGRAAGQDVKPEEYYPLKVGNSWTFSIGGSEDKFVIKAAREEKVGEQTCIVLEGVVKGNVVATEHVAPLKDGIYRFKFNGNVVEPPLCFCKLPVKKGEKWKADFKVGGTAASVTFEATEEEVKVPAGKYPTVAVHGTVTENKNTVRTTYWFSAKVGMVKQEIDFGTQKVLLELEKFEPPK